LVKFCANYIAMKAQPLISETARQWMNSIYDGIIIVDKNQKALFWNKGAEQITGYQSRDITGNEGIDALLEINEDNGKPDQTASTVFQEVISKGFTYETRLYLTHKYGYRFPVRAFFQPVRDSDENITGLVTIFRDISIEERFHHLEERYKEVIRQYVSETTYKEIIRVVSSDEYRIKAYNRNLTILFMDIVGFTGLSERLKPEKVVEMLNVYFTRTARVVQKNSGDIDKFLGDGVMAIFKDPPDAVNAAKDMIPEGLNELNRLLADRRLNPINLRIGINTGNLIQGNIGSEDRRDWTVVGDVVNTAYRIEEAAEPGHILISENTVKSLQAPKNYRFIKELFLKGKSKPIRVYSPY